MMSLIFKSPEARKWTILGIKAAITALAVLPQIRKHQQQAREIPSMIKATHSPSDDSAKSQSASAPGIYGLLFLNSQGEVISSHRFEHDVVNRYRVDREEIIRIAKDTKAYAAVVTFDRRILHLETEFVARKVVPLIADALSEAGVRVFQRAFMPKGDQP
ncbi:hypothetical protein VBY75_11825 [Idiomarina sp. HB]|uniref:hypothetical protein n=1 Tax=Idiomarina sp. HB TaxID=3110479 RepID=UPI003A8073D2